MARTDASMRLLDAALVAAISQHAEVFGQDFKGWCAANNVSRSTAYRHKKRIEERGRWEPLSTCPKSRPDHQTPPEVEAEIVQLRQELEELPGEECGADNVGYQLQQIAILDDWASLGWRVPSRASTQKIMKKHGLVRPEPNKRPKSSYRRFAYARPRDCYQIDGTEHTLADGSVVVAIDLIDDCSRLWLASHVAPAETSTAAIAAFTRAVTEWGAPGLLLADNGSAFTGRIGATNLTRPGRFASTVTATGARLIHSTPYHPQTLGKCERLHQTADKLLDHFHPGPADSIEQLQTRLDRVRAHYNTRRRHSA